MHDIDIAHRDLKPDNIGINGDDHLRILDFGKSREQMKCMSATTQSLWWRAPEVICNACQYNKTVDLWSTGVIIIEMFNRAILFRQATDDLSLMKCIFELCGSPHIDYFVRGKGISVEVLKDLPHYPGKPVSEMIPGASRPAIELVQALLQVYPENRILATDALHHRMFADLSIENPSCRLPLVEKSGGRTKPNSDFKDILWHDVRTFVPPKVAEVRLFIESLT